MSSGLPAARPRRHASQPPSAHLAGAAVPGRSVLRTARYLLANLAGVAFGLNLN